MALQGFNESYYLSAKLLQLHSLGQNLDVTTPAQLKVVLAGYGFTPESHYMTWGYKENLPPNEYFNAYEYITAKAEQLHANAPLSYPTIEDAKAAFKLAWPGDAYQHYLQFGAFEGINPSDSFDEWAYLGDKLALLQANSSTHDAWVGKTTADLLDYFHGVGLTPLTHFIQYGQGEGLHATAVAATYELTAGAASVNEGGTIVFTLDTTHVPAGTSLNYTLTGIEASRIDGGLLNGTVTVTADGTATITVKVLENHFTDGTDTLGVSVNGGAATASVTVNDTSVTPPQVLTILNDDVINALASDMLITGVVSDDARWTSTLNAGDAIHGNPAFDNTLRVTAEGEAPHVDGFTMDGVQTLEVRSYTSTSMEPSPLTVHGLSLGLMNVTGLEKVVSDNSTGDISLNYVQNIVDLELNAQNNPIAVDVHYIADAVAGDNDTQNIALDNFAGNISVGDSSHYGIENVAITTSGRSSDINLYSNDINAISIAGSADLTLEVDGSQLTTVDAHTFAHNLDLTADLDTDSSVVTSSGDDYLDLTIYGDGTAVINAGEGDNSVYALENSSVAGIDITTGAGDDTIVVYELDNEDETTVTVHAGNGHNVIGVYGDVFDNYTYTLASSITGGSGVDNVTIGVGGGLATSQTEVDGYSADQWGSVALGDGEGGVVDEQFIGGPIGNTLDVSGSIYGIVTAGKDNDIVHVGGPIVIESIQNTFSNYEDIGSVYDDGEGHIIYSDDDLNYISPEGGLTTNPDIDHVITSANINLGDGDNQIFVGDDINGNAVVVLGNGGNYVEVGNDIQGASSVTFGDGNNTLIVHDDVREDATIAFGNGSNDVSVDNDIYDNASFTFGNGSNTLESDGISDAASLTFGDGANDVTVYGDVEDNATLTFGDGANTLDLHGGYDFNGDNDGVGVVVEFGNGGNTINADALYYTTLTSGSGDDTLDLSSGGDLMNDSHVDLGAGADTLIVAGGYYSWAAYISGEKGTTVELGAGNDNATLVMAQTDHETESEDWATIVRSGATLDGGTGLTLVAENDTLTVESVDYANLVDMTEYQESTVTFNNSYQVGDVVTVTIAGVNFNYTVTLADLAQGPDSVASNVANGWLAESTDVDDPVQPRLSDYHFGGVSSDGVVTLTSTIIAEDLTITSSDTVVEVVQSSNTGVSGFETLNLVALNQIHNVTDSTYTHPSDETPELSANFDLITGVQQINLDSQETLKSFVHHHADTVGGDDVLTFTEYSSGDVTQFNLLNLPAGLGENITLSGNESSATGNAQVERIDIGNDNGDHLIGDVITVLINGSAYSYTVTAQDLAGDNAQEDADNIAEGLAGVLAAASGSTGFTVTYDDNQILLTGARGAEGVTVVTGPGTPSEDGVVHIQDSTPLDDSTVDVHLNATLAVPEIASESADVLGIDINGHGAFDLLIESDNNHTNNDFEYYGSSAGVDLSNNGFENLSLNVIDSYSHYIDTNGGNHNFLFGEVSLTGGAAGETITLDNLGVHTLTSTSAADVVAIFNDIADDDYMVAYDDSEPGDRIAFNFNITTGSGDDVVDMQGILFSKYSTVNLGEGTDRLKIDNGFYEAEQFTNSDEINEDSMWQHVRNVEEVEVLIGNMITDSDHIWGSDSLSFDEYAFAAGFETLIIDEFSHLDGLTVGDAFARDFAINADDDVTVDNLDIYTDNDVTINAGYYFSVGEGFIAFGSQSNVTITADDNSDLTLDSNGSGDIDINFGDHANINLTQDGTGTVDVTVYDDSDVTIDQNGNGAVTVDADYNNNVDVNIDGLGPVDITAGSHTDIFLSIGDNHNEADVTITQWDSSQSSIHLEGLNVDQDVTVNITVFGVANSTNIASLGGTSIYDTDLNVSDSNGGIDTLNLTSVWGDSNAVNVRIEDSWAVGSLKVDATDIQAHHLFINGSQEDDATLNILGSLTDVNNILGGGEADTITGGAADDILQGDAVTAQVEIYTVTFANSYDKGDVIHLTVDGEELIATVGTLGTISGYYVAEAFKNYIATGNDGESNISFTGDAWGDFNDHVTGSHGISDGAVLTLTGTEVGEGHSVTASVNNGADQAVAAQYQTLQAGTDGWTSKITFNGTDYTINSDGGTGVLDAGYTALSNAVTGLGGTINYDNGTNLLTITGHLDGAAFPQMTAATTGTLAFHAATGLPADQADPSVVQTQDVSASTGMAADVLTGGAGHDTFVVTESQLTNFDTITDLNIVNGSLSHDLISLGSFYEKTTELSWGDVNHNTVQELVIDDVVNGGVAVAMNGASLSAAVNSLFDGGSSPFHNGSPTDTNAAGLFTYGGETYLVAVGENSTGAFGADDFIVKVTGVTGILDTADFAGTI
ncbi:MAG: hypothetical protein HGB00_03655 [Chlorobiaceae bacterium]|nr:hypothetical protein [Chlorobiaceae bacterium]